LLVSVYSPLITPYGGQLVDLTVPVEAFDRLKAYASQLPSIQISPRSVCDLEGLATGVFSPLTSFMGKEDYQRVLDEMRLLSGQIFPIPITLPVEANPDIHLDRDITLRNNENELVAVMTINEIYKWDRTEFADKVFGTRDSRHPLVSESQSWGTLNISGRLQIMHLPSHYDFQDLRLTPSQTRSKLTDMGHKNVVAYQPLPLPHWKDLLRRQWGM
jgi:sulfate adenylyltransferase